MRSRFPAASVSVRAGFCVEPVIGSRIIGAVALATLISRSIAGALDPLQYTRYVSKPLRL